MPVNIIKLYGVSPWYR